MVRSGALWCWGSNSDGQLGLGEAQVGKSQLTPQLVDETRTWRSIAAGGAHTCGVDSLDQLWCWGANDYGQLGTAVSVPGTNHPLPVQVDGTRRWSNVWAGLDHTCAVALGGSGQRTLYCWGRNGAYQLALGDNTSRGLPDMVKITAPQKGSDIEWHHAGLSLDDHTCAVQHNNTLWCWGANGNGQLGQDGQSVALDRGRPNRIVVGSTLFSFVATGRDYTCALDTQGGLWCWGRNDSGQLGLGDTTDRSAPAQQPMLSKVQSLGIGYDHACAVSTERSVSCWGSNSDGQLGDGGPILVSKDTPQPTSGVAKYQAVGAGRAFSCALDENGNLWCWGKNSQGQLGVGDTNARKVPTQLAF